ncbi:hypothetical protein GYMLUDRAFT_55331 [Collybiopsis luxurians FD-317 M1]|nr:hypothetical protein GYMLUDRAFT_55331 [Collybiopsis luxurians FD-317 M1]
MHSNTACNDNARPLNISASMNEEIQDISITSTVFSVDNRYREEHGEISQENDTHSQMTEDPDDMILLKELQITKTQTPSALNSLMYDVFYCLLLLKNATMWELMSNYKKISLKKALSLDVKEGKYCVSLV